ncbi:MAG: translation initiation factor IF-2 [Candidatus Bathyarchaeia archaeon]
MPIRQPIVVVLGHVDHGKTTLLDKIRGTAVAAREPGAITQHIGASFVPNDALQKVCGSLLKKFNFTIEIPGLLFIDTPGHAAFSNLRRRGGSVADIAVLVIDLLQGIQPQTLESINILKARRTPFVVAGNKLDMITGWQPQPNLPFLESMRKQSYQALANLDEKIYAIVGRLSNERLNSDRFDRVKDFTKTAAIVPVSAKSGEGLPDLLTVLVGLTQQFMKHQLIQSIEPARGSVLEVQEDVGLGVNINAIIYSGILKDGSTIVVGGRTKPILTKVRALLLPKPLDEIRDPREKFKQVGEVSAAAGVKVVAPGLEDAIPGGPIYALPEGESPEQLMNKVKEEVESVKIASDKSGIIIKTDTLGALEAIVNELNLRSVPIRIGDVGDVSRRDVLEAEAVRSREPTLGVILGFNVKVLPDAHDEAVRSGVKIFRNNVIYQLLEDYTAWVKSEEEAKVLKAFESMILPGKVKLLRGCVFRRCDPAVFGVEVVAGRIKPHYSLVRGDGTPVGKISQIQDKGQNLPEATRGMQVAISMKEPTIGRQIREEDVLYVEVPEKHVEVLVRDFAGKLSAEELQTLKEYVELMRRKIPYFGFGI